MTQAFTKRGYLDALADHIVIFDGANGTQLQRMPLTPEDFGGEHLFGAFDVLALTRPSVLEQVHSAYYAAGSEVVETNTFRANRLTLREYQLQERVIEINISAAQAARRAADRYARETGIPRYVAGSIGPSGLLPASDDPVLSNVTFETLVDVFREQAVGLIKGGCDLLLIETSQDILEVKATILGIQRAFAETGEKIPLQCQITLDVTGRMLLGTDIAAALATLEALPVDVIGLNCSTGPEHMTEPIRYLGEHSRKPLSCLPNAGLPLNVDGHAVYPLQPEPFALALATFAREHGVNALGGCCGTTPEHITRLIAELGPTRKPVVRTPEHVPTVSSMMRATALIQDPAPMLIGERVNAQGSRAVKKLLLNDDYDGLLRIAREQVEGGAHTLDVCLAVTERTDEREQMRRTVKLFSGGVETPLVIDSTEPDAIEAALQACPGRAIVNPGSLLDGGPARVAEILSLVKLHGAALIAMTIDAQGMAKTAARKVDVARQIRDIAVEQFALADEDLIFDALTFTLATGQEEFLNSGVETIEGIRGIKRDLPGVLCSLGVSNVSFGFKPNARGVLNSVFLYHCVEAGLDMAIVNPKHVTPYAEIPAEERALADDLIFNRRPDALPRFIEHFESFESGAVREREVVDPMAGMTAEERIHYHILHRKKEDIEALIDEALTRHDPVWVLNNVLLPAMKDVGDRFGAGELILPFVLQSAEVMKKAVKHLEQFLEKQEGVTKGKVVLATVYGDVHDIGKSLVNTILSNNGYTVFDLGKQVPVNVIVDQAVAVGATAIGLSALLVSTSKQMPLVVRELHKRGLHIPVLIGGAAINRKFGRRTLFVEAPKDGQAGVPYESGVFYCKDAFEGLDVMDHLIDAGKRTALLERVHAEARHELERPQGPGVDVVPTPVAQAERYQPVAIPAPPFWGARTVQAMPLQEVFMCLDLDELFRLSWGAKNAQGAEWERLRAEFGARLEVMRADALRSGYLVPRAVYGYFPCNADGDSVVIYDPAPFTAQNGHAPELRELARFTFPRQPTSQRLCLSDYFAPRTSGRVDVISVQVVTVGAGADARFSELQARGDYAEAYFTHGLSVQIAEATAEYMHRHVRRELGLPQGQGKRYSWGYPACPDLEDHAQVFKLLPAERELGMALTPSWQLMPEQSTAAFVVHHPTAQYYSVGVSRAEQLR